MLKCSPSPAFCCSDLLQCRTQRLFYSLIHSFILIKVTKLLQALSHLTAIIHSRRLLAFVILLEMVFPVALRLVFNSPGTSNLPASAFLVSGNYRHKLVGPVFDLICTKELLQTPGTSYPYYCLSL